MSTPLDHPHESSSNLTRDQAARVEPRALRTYTPTQAVLAKSAGIFHWTPEGRRLYDFTSGVLVANLGHNPRAWMDRFTRYMGWSDSRTADAYFPAVAMTAYNAYQTGRTKNPSDSGPGNTAKAANPESPSSPVLALQKTKD